jgi:uncharacterized repeat protein (TIGR03803 family)
MNFYFKRLTLLAVFAAEFFIINPDRVNAQAFTNIHNFGGSLNAGESPIGSLILTNGILYGTTKTGGSGGDGTVFRMNPNGTGLTNLYQFSAGTSAYVNADGMRPNSALVLWGTNLFGIAQLGGPSGAGTVFRVGSSGGSTGYGVLFRVKADGSGYTNLHTFTGGDDGAYPVALALSGTNLYGATQIGGSAGEGVIFRMNTNGTAFTNLHSFTATSGAAQVNSDGAVPGFVIVSGNTIYGVAQVGGAFGSGTVFRLNTDGSGFTNLHDFATAGFSYPPPNTDGIDPNAIMLSGNTLFGTAILGGPSGNGTVFCLNTDGTGFTNLYLFSALVSSAYNSDGANPMSGLILSSNTLYGTTSGGGLNASGSAYTITLPPPPATAIARAGTNVVVTWPGSAPGVTLQSTTNLAAPAWATVTPAPSLINGLNTVTNALSGTQKFYRLSR